jgi:hypothetical protein
MNGAYQPIILLGACDVSRALFATLLGLTILVSSKDLECHISGLWNMRARSGTYSSHGQRASQRA